MTPFLTKKPISQSFDERKITRKFRQDFEEFCRTNPHVTTCLRVISEWTYEVDVQVDSNLELGQLRQNILEIFGKNISRVESIEYIKTHKMCPYPGMNKELHM